MDEGKAGYNFAFYMILFITIFTGGYYAYGKIKDKFFPQSTVSDYVKKKWRYWDDRRSQVYTNLVQNKCFHVTKMMLVTEIISDIFKKKLIEYFCQQLHCRPLT